MNKTYRYYSIAVLLFFVHSILSNAEAKSSFVPTPHIQSACADTIIVSVNEQCQFLLTFDKVLTGTLEGCTNDDFNIYVDDEDPTNGALVDGCGIFRYVIEASSPGSCGDFTMCWGYVQAEDKTAPVITPPDNITLTLACAQLDKIQDNPESLDITGRAVAYDNCSFTATDEVAFSDAVDYSAECGTIIITRTFRAEDEKGNRATVQQLIILQEPDLSDITINPEFRFDAGCDLQAEVARDEEGGLHPDVTGYPYYINSLGDTIYIRGSHCNLNAQYVDEQFPVCDYQEKTSRSWTVADWCSGQQTTLHQIIKFGDVDPPAVSCAQDTLHVSTDPFGCTATVSLPFPEVTELCGPYEVAVEFYVVKQTGPYEFPQDPDTVLFQSFPFSNDGQVIITEVPIGQHFARFIVRDECKNLAQLDCPVVVADEVSPTLSCDDQINLSLNDNGYGQLLATEISEGTNDNCGIALLETRRLYEYSPDDCTPLAPADTFYSEWGPHVAFSCCDAGQMVTVELRAFDIYGNVSTCWGTVLVEDKVTPRCVAPDDVTIACDALPVEDSLLQEPAVLTDLFGAPLAEGNCAADIDELAPVIDLDNCREGTITRTFRALDADGVAGEECQQIITVEAEHDYRIKFPRDYEEFCMVPSPDSVLFVEDACDLLAVSIQDDILETDAPECYKIFRTYRVINWCEYDGIAQPVVVPRDVDCDQKPGDEDVWVIRRRDGTVYYDVDSLETNAFPAAGSRDEICEVQNPEGYWYDNELVPEITSRGFWEYEQHIKVNDQIPPEIFYDEEVVLCSNANDCSGDVSVSFAVADNCVTDVDISIDVIEGPDEYFSFDEDPFRVVGRYPKYILDGKVPEGDYRIEIEASDRCGNVTRVVFSLRVVDCKAPSPICINGLATELMPVDPGTDADGDGDEDLGAMTVFVNDFIASEVTDCSGPVTYSINRKGETPNREQDFLVLTCDDPGYLEVEIHAWDNADNPFNISDEGIQGGPNHDFCLTYILVQDNMFGLCDTISTDGLEVSGTIQTATGLPVPDVAMRSNNGDLRSAAATDEQGFYRVANFAPGYDYSITPEKNDNHQAGVSTFDIVQISKHILNLKPLGSPYQHIAADINRSGTITTLDLIQLRRLVLNLSTEFSNNSSWRFVVADYQFANPQRAEAEAFPSTLNINNLSEDWFDANFIGVKIGDVNESAMLRASVDLRMPEQPFTAGETYAVPIYLDGANQSLEGIQAALQVLRNQADLIGVLPGQITEEFMHWQRTDNRLFISWDAFSGNTRTLRADQPLLTLQLRAKTDTRVSASFALDKRYLLAEAYTGNGRMILNLNFAHDTAVRDQLGSLFPNPFVERLQVQFALAEAQTITWTLTDARGRSVRSWTEDRAAGSQELVLHAHDVTGPGVYYLHLQTENNRFTHRIVHLR